MSTAEDFAEVIAVLFSNCQEKENRYVRKYGISIVDGRCLRILHTHKSLTVNHLAQHMTLTSSRITRIVDRLVEKKLVIRRACTSDRRIFNLLLTAAGKKLAAVIIEDSIRIHEEILASFSPEDRVNVIRILKKLNNSVEKWLKQHV